MSSNVFVYSDCRVLATQAFDANAQTVHEYYPIVTDDDGTVVLLYNFSNVDLDKQPVAKSGNDVVLSDVNARYAPSWEALEATMRNKGVCLVRFHLPAQFVIDGRCQIDRRKLFPRDEEDTVDSKSWPMMYFSRAKQDIDRSNVYHVAVTRNGFLRYWTEPAAKDSMTTTSLWFDSLSDIKRTAVDHFVVDDTFVLSARNGVQFELLGDRLNIKTRFSLPSDIDMNRFAFQNKEDLFRQATVNGFHNVIQLRTEYCASNEYGQIMVGSVR